MCINQMICMTGTRYKVLITLNGTVFVYGRQHALLQLYGPVKGLAQTALAISLFHRIASDLAKLLLLLHFIDLLVFLFMASSKPTLSTKQRTEHNHS